eukprot:CAMPEP_0119353878 /NCGR_PEP_ID=MMETSP1334-20130426/2974_1 /TAXON_ID=127549 /ORGANISM="Calcidiscus leptoporus, Strain RCC1130" /LENGTH=98 /DNA_ID=CAMNT_0007367273 /DNA_START=113 /DNA_END=409 /DNA_ORIENTATION=-
MAQVCRPQWAAVSSHWGWMSVAPQPTLVLARNWYLRGGSISSPPTILGPTTEGALKQFAGSDGGGGVDGGDGGDGGVDGSDGRDGGGGCDGGDGNDGG